MRHMTSLSALAVFLATAPASAQTDPAQTVPAQIDPAPAEIIEGDADGNFGRNIPDGLKDMLTEPEISAYQARLNTAATPQERNAIREELQRVNQQRHLSSVQNKKDPLAQPEQPERKSFFARMRDDFNNMMRDDDLDDEEDNDPDDADDDANDGANDDLKNKKIDAKERRNNGNSGNGGGKNK